MTRCSVMAMLCSDVFCLLCASTCILFYIGNLKGLGSFKFLTLNVLIVQCPCSICHFYDYHRKHILFEIVETMPY